jgi:starch synthase
VAVRHAFDPAAAHRLLAGADALLMPSRYEPCGLAQLMAMRYGTVPVVRRTGGLADTVGDCDPRAGTGTGFAFVEPTPEALLAAVDRLLAVWRDRDRWRALMRRGMRADWSWDRPARRYLELYRELAAG